MQLCTGKVLKKRLLGGGLTKIPYFSKSHNFDNIFLMEESKSEGRGLAYNVTV